MAPTAGFRVKDAKLSGMPGVGTRSDLFQSEFVLPSAESFRNIEQNIEQNSEQNIGSS